MNAILYVCHGSRVKAASDQAVSFIRQVMQKIDIPIQEIGFLELSQPSIEEAFERCVKKGATNIIAIPILLLTAGHAKEDIPNELQKLQLRFPNVSIKQGKPIGVHEKMIDLLLERIADTNIPVQNNASVVLVGRGSSDLDAKRDLLEIGNMLQERSNFRRVDVCFLAAAEPNLEEGLEQAKKSGSEQVFVIPYLFFTGVLMKKIEKSIKHRNNGNDPEFILCRYLGYHPIIEDIIYDQISALLSP